MKEEFGEYVISDDKTLLNIETICDFLSRSYWANKRLEATIIRSIEGSICYGVFHVNKQVGFARVVTDYATMYWIGDVFIDEEYRGKGIGKKLIQTIVGNEQFKNLNGILGTLDAHDLYTQYGFERDADSFMRRKPDFLRV